VSRPFVVETTAIGATTFPATAEDLLSVPASGP
jgi:hypothetical protein